MFYLSLCISSLMTIMTVANVLTLLRICLVPFICWFLTVKTAFAPLMATVLFSVAALTDYLDGYIAHKTKTKTALGSFLDPLADKILIILVFCTLIFVGRIHGASLCAAGIILFRELFMLALRPMTRSDLPVIPVAKWKTACQMCSALLFMQEGYPWCLYSAVLMLWMAAALSVYSALVYIKKSLHAVKKAHTKRF